MTLAVDIVATLLSFLLGAVMGAAGWAKLSGQPRVVDNLDRLGFAGLTRAIGGGEIALAIGLVLGVGLDEVRLVACLLLFALMAAAVEVHIWVGDHIEDTAPAVVLTQESVLDVWRQRWTDETWDDLMGDAQVP